MGLENTGMCKDQIRIAKAIFDDVGDVCSKLTNTNETLS